LLLGHFGFELTQTAMPKRALHERIPA
jgi:hypothetical protein